jgi:hypothetical protein
MFIAILHGTRNNTSLRGVYLLTPRPTPNPDGLYLDLPLLQFSLSELVFARVEFAVFNSRVAADLFLTDNPPLVPGTPVAHPIPTPRTPVRRSISIPPPVHSSSVSNDPPPPVPPLSSRTPPTTPDPAPTPTASSSNSSPSSRSPLVASVILLQREKIRRRTSARIQQLHNAEQRQQRLATSSDSGPS